MTCTRQHRLLPSVSGRQCPNKTQNFVLLPLKLFNIVSYLWTGCSCWSLFNFVRLLSLGINDICSTDALEPQIGLFITHAKCVSRSPTQCCIIAFLMLMEGRVRAWTVKLGRQPRVEQMLHEYQLFVSDRNVFHEFEQAYIEMKQVADAFVKEGGVGEYYWVLSVHSTSLCAEPI